MFCAAKYGQQIAVHLYINTGNLAGPKAPMMLGVGGPNLGATHGDRFVFGFIVISEVTNVLLWRKLDQQVWVTVRYFECGHAFSRPGAENILS